jgi:CRISPR-associated endonuclease/helicase Cas3
MILAKPNGISLKNHTENVLNELYNYLQKRKFVISKYERVNKNIVNSLELICRYHDIGKKQKDWQEACIKEYEYYLIHKKVKGSYLGNAKTRHEIFSLKFCEDNGLLLTKEELAGIGSHHGKLSEKHKDKWKVWSDQAGLPFWKKLKELSYEIQQGNFQDWITASYKYDCVRAILQFADKRASAKEVNESLVDYNSFEYSFSPSWKKRPVQRLAEENANEDLLLLRAPTGAGKTDASLLWANQQINVLKRADRLVIALPTRFTSNALALNISESVSKTGLYHSTSKFSDFQSNGYNAFAKLLETPVTVCTIDHLLLCLSKTKEEHHHIFFNLANACIVIDEADFYDEYTQANLLVFLEAMRILKVPILLMSASLPQSSLLLYQQAGFQISKIHEDTSDNKRDRCQIKDIIEYEGFECIQNLLKEATTKPSIIYVNTVDKAVKLKQWFSKNHPDKKVILYHSRFTEPDKKIKEEILLSSLGQQAWQENNANGIAILTQIGEMSVNISADFMISEICPIDRLVQRIGRLSRFRNEPGEVIILKPLKNGIFYPAPYGSFENRSWKINEALEKTIKLISCRNYSSDDFVNIVNKIYEQGVVFSDKSKTNANKLRELIKHNWLILPNFELDEAEDSGYWKTRNIPEQILVLVLDELEDNYFNSHTEFEKIKIRNGVTCPAYLVKKNINQGKLMSKKVYIRDDDEHLFLLSSKKMYDSEYGLDLSLEGIEDQFL